MATVTSGAAVERLEQAGSTNDASAGLLFVAHPPSAGPHRCAKIAVS